MRATLAVALLLGAAGAEARLPAPPRASLAALRGGGIGRGIADLRTSVTGSVQDKLNKGVEKRDFVVAGFLSAYLIAVNLQKSAAQQSTSAQKESAAGGSLATDFEVADADRLWHAMSEERCCRILGTDPEVGLTAHAHANLLAEHGPNELEAAPRPSLWSLVLEQFEDRLVQILLCVAVFSAVHWRATKKGSCTLAQHPSCPELPPKTCPNFAFCCCCCCCWWPAGAQATSVFDSGGHEGLAAFVEPMAILAILVLNAAVGVWQVRSRRREGGGGSLKCAAKLSTRGAHVWARLFTTATLCSLCFRVIGMMGRAGRPRGLSTLCRKCSPPSPLCCATACGRQTILRASW